MPDINSLALAAADNYKKTFSDHGLELKFVALNNNIEDGNFLTSATIRALQQPSVHNIIKDFFKNRSPDKRGIQVDCYGSFVDAESDSNNRAALQEDSIYTLRAHPRSDHFAFINEKDPDVRYPFRDQM